MHCPQVLPKPCWARLGLDRAHAFTTRASADEILVSCGLEEPALLNAAQRLEEGRGGGGDGAPDGGSDRTDGGDGGGGGANRDGGGASAEPRPSPRMVAVGPKVGLISLGPGGPQVSAPGMQYASAIHTSAI